jgi:hypothetical protein
VQLLSLRVGWVPPPCQGQRRLVGCNYVYVCLWPESGEAGHVHLVLTVCFQPASTCVMVLCPPTQSQTTQSLRAATQCVLCCLLITLLCRAVWSLPSSLPACRFESSSFLRAFNPEEHTRALR